MKAIELSLTIFRSEEAFHSSFAEIMGFPGFYGHNWNAWIDCMSYVDDPSAGMSRVLVAPDEQLEFVVQGYEFCSELDESDVFRDFCICAGFVNSRFRRRNSGTRIVISN